MWGIKLAGVANLGGVAASGVIVFGLIGLLLFGLGRCNFLFRPVGLVRSTPTPTVSGAVAGTPTPSVDTTAAPTPNGTPVPGATGTPTPEPGATPTPTPASRPTATPTPGPPQPVINLPAWPQGEVNVGYPSTIINASSGSPPYTWTGTPPAGLNLATDGTVSGIPQTTGAPFTVQVTDSRGQSASANTSVPIAPALVASACGGNICNVEFGCANVCGTYTGPSGGVPPYSYKQTSGGVPGGTTFGGPSLSGQFLKPGRFQFGVDVSDGLATVSISPLFDVFGHLSLGAGGGGGPLPNGPASVSMPLASFSPIGTKITLVTINEGPGYSVIPGTVAYDGKTLTFKIAGSWKGTTQAPFQATAYDNFPCDKGVNCFSTADVNLSMG